MPNDGVSESVAPEKTDTMKSYTPYIHFTKLEFKVLVMQFCCQVQLVKRRSFTLDPKSNLVQSTV